VNKKQYKKEIYQQSFINESTGDNYLDKVVNQLVSETIIEWEEKGISYPHIRSCWYYINDPTPHRTLFTNYITNLYGLTKEEANYIWEKYNDSIIHKIDNNREKLGRWRGGEALNESVENSYLDKIVDQIVNETNIDYKKEKIIVPFSCSPSSCFFNSRVAQQPPSGLFINYSQEIYGLTDNEIQYVWTRYIRILRNKII
jgi:hypothetical protein